MKPYTFTFSAGLPTVSESSLSVLQEQLRRAGRQEYALPAAPLQVPFDTSSYEQTMVLVAAKQRLNPTIMVIVGIGGSNLGTLAIHEALHGRWYNDANPPLKIYFADTVEPLMLAALVERLKAALAQGNEILLVVISKSGTTTETMVNFYLLEELLKQWRLQTYAQFVVAITDHGSALWQLAQQHGYDCLPIPAPVGGRYSVLTAVGMFPLAMIGVDTQQLRAGAQAAVDDNLQHDADAATMAMVLYHYYQRGYTIHDHFIFFPNGESIGRWYRQLLAESIGKEYNQQGQQVRVGITPTVSIGTTDLHSVAQLNFSGPQQTVTTFLTQEYSTELSLPTAAQRVVHAPVTYEQILSAIVQGVQHTYQQLHKPYMHLALNQLDAYTLGYLLQMHMIQIIYLGHLLEVNPFDQPQVELYKKAVQQLLKRTNC